LILLDRQMPGMDGLSLAERIVRAHEPAGAAIMLLASGQRPGDADRCRELGLAACLLKPIKPSELRAAIQSVLADASPQGRAAGAGAAGAPADAADPDPDEPFDREALLQSIDGDRALLAEIAALFLDGCPAALHRMRVAIEARNAEVLGRAAHSFKGSLGFFF